MNTQAARFCSRVSAQDDRRLHTARECYSGDSQLHALKIKHETPMSPALEYELSEDDAIARFDHHNAFYKHENDESAQVQAMREPEVTPVATRRAIDGSDSSSSAGHEECAWRTAHTISRLFKRTKDASETYADFAAALRSIGGACPIGEELYVTAFIAGINDEFTAALLRVVAPQSLSAAAREATRLRDSNGAQARSKRSRKPRSQRKSCQNQVDASGSLVQRSIPVAPEAAQQQSASVVQSAARKVEEVRASVPPASDSSSNAKREVQTVACAESPPRKQRRAVCFSCAQIGHIRRNCSQRVKLL